MQIQRSNERLLFMVTPLVMYEVTEAKARFATTGSSVPWVYVVRILQPLARECTDHTVITASVAIVRIVIEAPDKILPSEQYSLYIAGVQPRDRLLFRVVCHRIQHLAARVSDLPS